MTSSSLQRVPAPVREITGKPGQSWGNFVMPARGEVTMKISGDLLETKILTAFGLDQREIKTRIQRIETVERSEGRLWWLLWIGIPLLFTFFIGIIPIVLFFIIKQKWIVVHNNSGNLLLFYQDSTKAKNFCHTLMAISRQLNSKSSPATSNGATPQDRRNEQRQRVVQPPQNA